MAATFLNLGMYFDYDDSSYAIVEKEKMIPKTHEYLFRFLEANLSRLETYAETYLRCIDTVHPENSNPATMPSFSAFLKSCPRYIRFSRLFRLI